MKESFFGTQQTFFDFKHSKKDKKHGHELNKMKKSYKSDTIWEDKKIQTKTKDTTFLWDVEYCKTVGKNEKRNSHDDEWKKRSKERKKGKEKSWEEKS